MALGSDRRIGFQFLYPGLGFGGSCFPKDTRAFASTARELGIRMHLTEAAIVANEEPVERLFAHMQRDLEDLAGKVVAVWGLAFKPRTDDVREAAAIRLIEMLTAAGARVRATDPQALETTKESLDFKGIQGVELFADEYEACEGVDALVLATEWNEYRTPDFERIAKLMRGRHVFDGRNILVPAAVADAGLRYRGMGRPVVEN